MGDTSLRAYALAAGMLLFFLSSAFGQVSIRERIVITPNPPPPQLSLNSSPTAPLLLKQTSSYGAQYAVTTRSGVLVSMGGRVEVSRLPRGTGYELEVAAGGVARVIARSFHFCDESTVNETSSYPATTVPLCGTITAGLRLFKRSTYTYYCASVWGSSGTSLGVSGSSATFTLEGSLMDLDVYPAQIVPITATVQVSASVDPEYVLAHIDVLPGCDELTCGGQTGVTVSAVAANGSLVSTCAGTEPLVAIASLQAQGSYAYLVCGRDTGMTVPVPLTGGRGGFSVVLDTSKGIIPDGSDAGMLSVELDGVVGTAAVAFRCAYPPPTVQIVQPASDTVIVLSPENKPDIVLRERHTPVGGAFTPTITWDPAVEIRTAEYYESFEDTLVLDVSVTARNDGGTARDTRRITLVKRESVLDHFEVVLDPARVPCGQPAAVYVKAKDKKGGDVSIDGGTLLNIVLQTEEPFGDLVAMEGAPAKQVRVTYADASAGRVGFISICAGPIGPEGQPVSVGVTLVGDEEKQGVGTVTVTGEIKLVILSPDKSPVELEISASPEMPVFEPKAHLKNYYGGFVRFSWRLHVGWRSEEPRDFAADFFGETSANNSDATTWRVPWNGVITGGQPGSLHLEALTAENKYVAEIESVIIRGENPTKEKVKEGLSIAEQVIVYMESFPKWKHFRSDGMPLFGKPRGYGLMQIDNPTATDEEVWNWKANKAAGKRLFALKMKDAKGWPGRIRARAQLDESNSNYLPPCYRNALDFGTEKLLLTESFQRYNGGNYWFWEPDDIDDPDSGGSWLVQAKPRENEDEPYGQKAWEVYAKVLKASNGDGTYPSKW